MASEVGTFSAFTDDSGSGTWPWANETNAYVSDNNYASSFGAGVPADSYLLHLYTAGLSAMADGDTIDGAEFAVERRDAGTGVSADEMWARNADGSASTNSDVGGAWPPFDTVDTKGGPADTFGEAWAGIDAKDTDFGCILQITFNGGSSSAFLDAVIPTVYYTPAPPWVSRTMPRGVMRGVMQGAA